MSRSRSRSAMISDIGRSNRARAAELLAQRRREVAGVEEAGLRVDARLRLQRRHRERAVDQQQRGERERDQPGVRRPRSVTSATPSAASTRSVERLWNESRPVSRRRMPAREAEHRRERAVVERDDRRASPARPPARAHLLVRPRRVVEDEVRDRPRREEVERVVRDVERLHVPRVAHAAATRAGA